MSIQNLGGTVNTFVSAGSYGTDTGVLLSDGTILLTAHDTATTMAVRYSTDEGATWTQCATKITVPSGEWTSMLTADEFDYIYIHTEQTGNLADITACSFSGTDITILDNEGLGVAYPNKGSLVAIDNPTRTGDHTHVAFTGASGGSGIFITVDFNRDTELFDSGSQRTASSPSISFNMGLVLLLSNTTEDKRVAATPADPEAALIAYTGATVISAWPVTWDSDNDYWTVGSVITETVSSAVFGGACYDPSLGRIFIIGGESNTSAGVVTGDMPITTLTARADLSFVSGPEKATSLAPITNGNGDVRVVLMEDDAANVDLIELVWSEGSTAFGSESTISATQSLEHVASVGKCSLWSSGGRLLGYTWVIEGSAQPKIYTNWTEVVAASALLAGWGFIPI